MKLDKMDPEDLREVIWAYQKCVADTVQRFEGFVAKYVGDGVIGHLKAEHRMGRNYLAHHAGDAINAVLAAAGYNFHLLLRWLQFLLSRFLAAQQAAAALQWV